MMDYQFFLSYARLNYNNANRVFPNPSGNNLKDFFKTICKRVSDLTTKPFMEVGYFDQERLKMADFWNKQLVDNGLQKSRVLLAIISPNYLKSKGCGREVQFFMERLKKTENNANQQQQCHRIIPVFWISADLCFKGLNSNVSKLINKLQWTQIDMPNNYPATGVEQMYNLGERNACNKIVEQISQRIYELANLPPLDKLYGQGDFSELPSAFHSPELGHEITSVASGPTGTNVVYIIGNRQEMTLTRECNEDTYGDKPENLRPFAEAPGATVELATQEGLNTAQAEYYNLGFPQDLSKKIDEAEKRNSSVLMVLDRHALNITRFKDSMKSYDKQNYDHVGLVTAYGKDVKDAVLKAVFPFKFCDQYRHHIWTVPSGRKAYVDSVFEVVSGLKQRLQQTGTPSSPSPSGPIPGLSCKE